jgi:hypothetical protein
MSTNFTNNIGGKNQGLFQALISIYAGQPGSGFGVQKRGNHKDTKITKENLSGHSLFVSFVAWWFNLTHPLRTSASTKTLAPLRVLYPGCIYHR